MGATARGPGAPAGARVARGAAPGAAPLPRGPVGRAAARAVLVVGGLVAAGWLGAFLAVLFAANRDGARPAQAIIVLGAAQYDGRPSPVLRARLDHAIALWHRGLAPRLIVTGGRRAGDRTSEAATGRRYAVAHGVPDSAILMESEGRTTAESLRAAAVLLAELERTAPVRARQAGGEGGASGDGRGARSGDVGHVAAHRAVAVGGQSGRVRASAAGEVEPVAPRSAILVSDPFHMLRLGVLARRYGIVPYTSPTRTSPISERFSTALGYMLRESLKIPVVLLTEARGEED